MAKRTFWEWLDNKKWHTLWDLYDDLRFNNAKFTIQLLSDGEQLFAITHSNKTSYYFLRECVVRKRKVYFLQ